MALGKFGEVVLLDWGLAKFRNRFDIARSRWHSRLEEYRETEDFRTVAGALGTPGYMSPEAAMGRLDHVDEQSDVYSLACILYEILSGCPTLTFNNFLEFLTGVRNGVAASPSEIDGAVPTQLSEACMHGLAVDRDIRLRLVGDLSGAVREWLTDSASRRGIGRPGGKCDV